VKPSKLPTKRGSTALVEINDSAGRRVRAYAHGDQVVFRVHYVTHLGQLDRQSDDYVYQVAWARETGRILREAAWRTVAAVPLRDLQLARQYGTAIGLEDRGRGQRPYIRGADVVTVLVAWDRRAEGHEGPLQVVGG